jgi:hypothetical protein
LFKKIAVALAAIALVIAGTAAPAQASTIYYYADGNQIFPGTPGAGTLPNSLYANLSGLNPTLDSTLPDYEAHTLVEIALVQNRGGTTRDIVEVGLRKPTGSSTMKVFVYAWRGGTGCGYSGTNMCGSGVNFVPCDTVAGVNNCGQATDNWDVGDSVASGTVMKMGLLHSGGAWWFTAYQSGGTAEFLGSISDTLWSGASISFVDADQIHAYGEVAPGAGALGCTDMGKGLIPTSTSDGAYIASITPASSSSSLSSSTDIDSGTTITDPTKYQAIFLGTNPANYRTMVVGGPSAC